MAFYGSKIELILLPGRLEVAIYKRPRRFLINGYSWASVLLQETSTKTLP